MTGTPRHTLDAALSPRPGQQATLDLYGHRSEGTVRAFLGTSLEVVAPSTAFLRHLTPESHLRVRVEVKDGVCETVLSRLSVEQDVVAGEIIGQPTYLERRAAPRVEAALPAALVWLDSATGDTVRVDGRTRNISIGGAVLEVDDAAGACPQQDVTALLDLHLPDVAEHVALAVRVQQAWDGGMRLRIVHTPPASLQRLSAFIAAGL